ncbi:MAG: acyltransferase family protein [Pseudomonadota bacterium]
MQYRAEIDGLRALAVVPVILFHAGLETFAGGFVGVDVFFVISGYLITTIIVEDLKNGSFSLADFYERRARRILPALLFVMAVCLPFAWMWLLPTAMVEFVHSMVAASFFSSNFLFWSRSGYFETAAELNPLLHTWSLAVEEQYYLLFPLFMIGIWRFGISRVSALLMTLLFASLLLAQWAVYNAPDAAFFLLPTRCWELLIGALAALHMSDKGHFRKSSVSQIGSLLGFLLIMLAIILYDKQTPFPGVYALIPTLGTVLIVLCAVPGTFVNSVLSFRPLVAIGLISYSAYLWHQPLFAFARHRLVETPSTLTMLGLCLLTLVLAYGTWRFVERPFRSRSTVPSTQLIPSISVAVVVVVSIGGGVQLSNGFAARLNMDVLELAATPYRYLAQRDDGGCNRDDSQIDLTGCIRGADVSPTFALLGDSHAAALERSLTNEFAAAGKSYIQYTKNGCPVAFGFNNRRNHQCGKYLENAVADIRDRGIRNIVIAARWSGYIHKGDVENGVGGIEYRPDNGYTISPLSPDAEFDRRARSILAAYEKSIERFNRSGTRIFLVGSSPEQGWNAPLEMARRLHFTGAGNLPDMPLAVYETRNKDVDHLFRALSKHQNIFYVDPKEILCDTDSSGCPSSRDGEPLYYDSNHLTNSGADLLVEDLMHVITQAPDRS